MLRGTGRGAMMFTVPCTRGSMRKLRPVISDTAFTTAWMSALTKLSVTVSSPPEEGGGGSGCCACAAVSASSAATAAAANVLVSNRILAPQSVSTLWLSCSLTAIGTVIPPRCTSAVNEPCIPRLWSTRATSASLITASPFTERTTSPGCSPMRSSRLPGGTCWITRPSDCAPASGREAGGGAGAAPGAGPGAGAAPGAPGCGSVGASATGAYGSGRCKPPPGLDNCAAGAAPLGDARRGAGGAACA